MLAGAKSYNELPHWYNACDVFCSPSYREEFPLNILEALFCGKPIIATEVGIAPEIIRKDLNGVLVPAGMRPDLAQAISWACHQRWSTEKIAAFGSNFSLDKSVNHTLKILGNMIENQEG